MYVLAVHPVTTLSEVFCVTCSLFRFVSDISGDQIVLAYSSLGRTKVLCVARRVSFCLPQDDP
jgi:hypothetical protein